MTERLYVVTRRNLASGDQAVQALHAALEYTATHPEAALALLVTENEATLRALQHQADRHGVRCTAFREPDRGHELTALALEPAARRLVQGLDPALR